MNCQGVHQKFKETKDITVTWAKRFLLRWLNTILAVCDECHLPNHGARKVTAHKLNLSK